MSAPARLLGLRVQGFKSFAERTLVEFGPGISAVVGPNGSGKSNLADALRWALGEQGRSLRIRRSEDVIWAGSERRAAQGMADVTIVLDNGDALLPVEYSVVELGRRLYRSGENDYLLNRQRVRLRDLVDLLDSANLAENAFLFIGQGMVDQALALRPEERRPLFEEVAGVRRHERRRRKAEEQLAEAEGNLARVEDILAELRPQARRLGQLAEQQATRLTAGEELAAALIVAAHGRWHEAATRAAQAERGRDALRAESGAALEALERAESEVDRHRGVDGGPRRARAGAPRGVRVRPRRADGARPARGAGDRRSRVGRPRPRAHRARARRGRSRARGTSARPRPARPGARPRPRGGARRRGPRARRGAGRARRPARREPGAGRRARGGRARRGGPGGRGGDGSPASRRRPAPGGRRSAAGGGVGDAPGRARGGPRHGARGPGRRAGRRGRRGARERRRPAWPSTRAEGTRRAAADRAAKAGSELAAAAGRLEALQRRLADEEARGIARAARKVGGRRVDEELGRGSGAAGGGRGRAGRARPRLRR